MSHKTFDDPHGKSDKARQGLLDNRCEKKPKNHGTLRRKKRISAVKRAQTKAKVAAINKARRKYLQAARAYWRGETDNHPA